MAQVAARSAQQANGSSPRHFHAAGHHRKGNRQPDSSSSPRSFSGDKLKRSASFSASSLPATPTHKHTKSTSSVSKDVSRSADGGELQATMKQRGMLHALLAEPVRFVKSNEKQGQDYSSMGIVPVNEAGARPKANGKASADSLMLHTSSPKLNGNGPTHSATSANGTSAEAGPSSLAPASPTKAKKQARDFYPYKISLRFPGKVRPAATGLSNYGNTCYMNSVMQALVHTPPLAYALLTQELEALHGEWGGKPNVNFDAVAALHSFAKRSLQGSRNVNAPQEFNRNLKAFAKPLRQGRQEDAHEYMRFLLEAIQQSCLSRAPKGFKPDDPARQTTFVQKIFGGKLRSRVTCHNCNHNSDTFDPIMDLSLDMRKGINSLGDAFRAFVAKDRLTGSEKYRCDSCKRRVDATKQFTIEKAPLALTIHLKRFTIFGGKISRQIAFEDSINIAPYMSDRSGSARYRLYAVVHHYGSGPNSGHYVASVKSPSGKWTHMDDSHVSEMNRQGPIGDASAYILFYLREEKEALEQAISATAGVGGGGKGKASPGFPGAQEGASSKKRKQSTRSELDERDPDSSDADSSDDDSGAAPPASSMAAKLQRLSDKQRQELLRARAKSAASSPSQTSELAKPQKKKPKQQRRDTAAASGASETSEQESDGGPSGRTTSSAKSSKALDGLLSSKPKSAASFYGSSSGAKKVNGLLDFGDEDGDELGTAVARDEYESLVGSKANGKPAFALASSEAPSDDDDDGSSASAQRVPLSKKQKRLQKKAASSVALAAKRGPTASPYALAQMGGGHGPNNASGSAKKKKNKNKHKGKPDGPSGKLASRMKPRST
ncbi:uncharacterized protein PFL1_04166 [Pseudozyma flocculosa PF-1]|uniref:Ubiquitin carboxyl-terminal hydrolase n=2 Tax=Pseudozyma flocculosa TaxID=84751 RepID=A0A5C3EUF3_9BASI|nr:uncharacterized protein PFL1_04166 [Pseudozyma flocculosa PF-1]EPQ28339.1 hypothetical protein PFL1_04166 [Pseudozyma flocculosa PF-1]SPO35490.1 related to ubiquitin carboxyl-terminal hydrolase 36 [Pseudozyma flocculosa]